MIDLNDYNTVIKQQAIYQSASIIAGMMYNNSQDVDVDKAISIATNIVEKVYAGI